MSNCTQFFYFCNGRGRRVPFWKFILAGLSFQAKYKNGNWIFVRKIILENIKNYFVRKNIFQSSAWVFDLIIVARVTHAHAQRASARRCIVLMNNSGYCCQNTSLNKPLFSERHALF